ncbi:MAG: glutaredoxin family protein [Streptomycetales bacterium]
MRTRGVSAHPRRSHHVRLLTKPGCHLCDEAREVVARVAADLGVPWDEIDITGDDELRRGFAEQIPVTMVDGRQHDFWRVDERRLRRALTR